MVVVDPSVKERTAPRSATNDFILRGDDLAGAISGMN